MVNLISKEARDDIGLTSWWRAIVWSVISLKASISNPAVIDSIPNYPYANAVRIALGRSVTDGVLSAALTIEATLPYQKSQGINAAGQFIPHLKEFYEGLSVIYDADNPSELIDAGLPVTDGGDGLPNEPDYVDTLEKYFLWVCWEGERELLDPLPSKLLPITIDFFEESTPDPTIKVKAIIPIDYAFYRANQNFVCSVLNPGFALSPAGLRAFSWEEIVHKPNFHPVATSGDYSDLDNTPSIPSQVSELEGFNALIRFINGEGPDPETGNLDLSLNVASVDWTNITSKPSFQTVATSGSYADLSNKPTIPSNVNQLTGYNTLVRSINNTTPDPNTGNVSLTVTSDWSGIQNKPSFATVAFSGSYDDLSNKPTIPSGSGGTGNLTLSGKKNIFGGTSTTLIWASDGDANGVAYYLGTNAGTQPFSNPITSGKIGVTLGGGANSNAFRLTDRLTNNALVTASTAYTLRFDFYDYTIKPNKIIFYNQVTTSGSTITFKIQGSNNASTWTDLADFTANSTPNKWNAIDISTTNFYRYLRLNYLSTAGSATSYGVHEVEFYGELFNTNVADGSLVVQLAASDLDFVLVPDIKIGTFILPDLTNISIGKSYYFYNPNALTLAVIPTSGQTIIKANNFNTISQNQMAILTAISSTEWIMF